MISKRFIFSFFLLVFMFFIGIFLYSINLDYILSKEVYQTKQYTKSEEIPAIIKESFVAVEDRRFYSHHGFDPVGMLRMGWVAIKEGEFTQGASTITQQVARNAFLNQDQTIDRKIKEIIIAINLDYHYEKDEILESYINIAYYGKGAYGIKEATSIFFDKDLAELETHEVAYLVGLVKGPSLYSENDELALERRNIVLDVMEKEDIIKSGEAEQWKALPLH